MGKSLIVAIALAVGCGGEEPPSCQQAVQHYYGAGCALLGTNGVKYTELEVIADCKQSLAAAPASCEDELEDLRFCFGGVRSPASSNADCDCTSEQDALYTCE